MTKHSEIGLKGEQIAADFLQNKGYSILHRNWRSGKKEIDIIAHKQDMLVVVEIKTRSRVQVGFPEDSVNTKKRSYLRIAAEMFINENPQYRNIRFDIISIWMESGNIKEIMHFEEAFY